MTRIKIRQIKTPDEFEKIKRAELHRLWFNQAMTDKQIATMYGVDKKTVRAKRKELNIKWLNSGVLSVAGRPEYKEKQTRKEFLKQFEK